MRNKEIIAILSLVAFAFLLVGVLQYFHLYEGLESGTNEEPPKDTEENKIKDDNATITKYDF